MNIALEHNMVGLIVSAVFDWADGKYSKVRFRCYFLVDYNIHIRRYQCNRLFPLNCLASAIAPVPQYSNNGVGVGWETQANPCGAYNCGALPLFSYPVPYKA